MGGRHSLGSGSPYIFRATLNSQYPLCFPLRPLGIPPGPVPLHRPHPPHPPHTPTHTGQQGVLLELLEAPALMDTCVRNGVYDEPLDLAAALGRLALLHPTLPVVGLLQQQVRDVRGEEGASCNVSYPEKREGRGILHVLVVAQRGIQRVLS